MSESVLIVEDEVDWHAIYQRVAKRQGVTTIEFASDFASAERILQERKFAVAIVDIGLNVDDDRNVDGLRVMEFIRTLGDETSIIVVTGRSGADVVPITRDALRKYNAFDAVGKVPIEPAEIQRVLAEALQAYKDKDAASRPAVHDVLRGDLDSWIWDDQMLRATRIGHGAKGLYDFLEGLFARFLPVVAPPAAATVTVDDASGVAHCAYWSRAIGQAVAVILGPKANVETARATSGSLLGRYETGPVLHSVAAGDVEGFVFGLPGADRQSFPIDRPRSGRAGAM